MKKLLLLSLVFACCIPLYAQSLEGEWRGSYYSNSDIGITGISNPITLYFVLNKDSSYNIFSYSRGYDAAGNDTVVVCKVRYKKTAVNSFCLEETQVLLPKDAPASCFQSMTLELSKTKKMTVLEGTWKTDKACGSSGSIKFVKKD